MFLCLSAIKTVKYAWNNKNFSLLNKIKIGDIKIDIV